MKKFCMTAILLCGMPLFAGFGVMVGGFSPTQGIDDNDNSVLLGANIKFKVALVAIKIEGFYVDSSGDYANRLGDSFGPSTVETEAILAADVMFYPIGTLFFVQGGVNYTSLDATSITSDLPDLTTDAIDNEFGIEAGLGVSLLDKLTVQGKIMYTPGAFSDDAVSVLEGLDDNLLGYMVTVGWEF